MGKNVLVVDDDPLIRFLVAEYLKNFGHAIEIVETGSACLARLEETLPDLVMLDLQMPDMTGMEVLEKIRANPRTARLRVIMLSANSSTDRMNLQADGYLQKPFEMKEVLRMVEESAKAGSSD